MPDEVEQIEQADGRIRVFAMLPRCPHCGAADRVKVVGTYRPLGRDIASKVQYVECRICSEPFTLEWE